MYKDGSTDELELRALLLSTYFSERNLSQTVYDKNMEEYFNIFDTLGNVMSRLLPYLKCLGHDVPSREEFGYL